MEYGKKRMRLDLVKDVATL